MATSNSVKNKLANKKPTNIQTNKIKGTAQYKTCWLK